MKKSFKIDSINIQRHHLGVTAIVYSNGYAYAVRYAPGSIGESHDVTSNHPHDLHTWYVGANAHHDSTSTALTPHHLLPQRVVGYRPTRNCSFRTSGLSGIKDI